MTVVCAQGSHVGSMLGGVGPMLGHPGPMLCPCWAYIGLMVRHVEPCWAYVGPIASPYTDPPA